MQIFLQMMVGSGRMLRVSKRSLFEGKIAVEEKLP